MQCPKCGYRVDLNRTIRKLRQTEKRLSRNGLLDPPDPSLWPLHVRMKMNPDKIPELVARFCVSCQVKTEDVFSPSRLKQYVIPRHVLMWFLAENSHLTVSSVAKMFGKHHATVVHACKSVKRHLEVGDHLMVWHVNTIEQIAPEVWKHESEESEELVG